MPIGKIYTRWFRRKDDRVHMHRHESLVGWAMALPSTFLLLLFLVLPFLMAFGLSLTNQRLISPNPTRFVGFRNFARLLSFRVVSLLPLEDEASGGYLLDEDGEFVYPKLRDVVKADEKLSASGFNYRELFSWQRGELRRVLLSSDVVFIRAVLNTFFFVIFVVPIQAFTALLLALLLNRALRGINVFRTIYFMPVVVSMVIIAMLWRFIYDGQNGLFNSILSTLSFGAFEPVDWLGNTRTVMPAIIGMSIWQGVGFHMVIWLAGLQGIPSVLYEAAKIDGASYVQQIRYITWPGLRNTRIFVFLVITMQAFGLFIQIDVMTKGGPLDATQSIVFQAIERGYGKQDIAGGSSISVFFFVVVLVISIVLRRYLVGKQES